MITREYLASYIYLESNIKSIQRRLNYFKTHPVTSSYGVVNGSMSEFPYTACHFVVSGANVKTDEERKKVVKQLIIDLEGNKKLYEDMKLDIESFINKLDSIEDKTIMRLKYIDRYTDEQIGRELKFDRSTINRKIDKIIKKSEVAHNSHS